jgi:hypothetical protein
MRFLFSFLLALLPLSLFAIEKDSTVSLSTSTGKIYGTLTLPAQKAHVQERVPIVIIIAGSGPANRDGNSELMGGAKVLTNNSLLALGDSLAKYGIASLRYDKRGIGASKSAAPDEESIRFDDYVSDAIAWVKMMQHDPRFSKVFIAGHSEGSLVGMLAAQRVRIAGFISISGVAVTADSIIMEQLGRSPAISSVTLDSLRQFFSVLRGGHFIDSIPKGIYQMFLRKSVQPYLISWMKYVPAHEIAKLKMPVLIIQGTTDIQVDTVQAFALKAAKPNAKLVIIDRMNHVLKDLPSRDLADNQLSYMDPGFLLSPKLTPAISGFVFAALKKK